MGTDRKRPLAAFLVVAVIAVVLLVTSVRSQASSGWLNHRLPASVVAVVPGSGESGLWHAVGDGVTQVVRHGAVLAHKATPDASSGETTVADEPPSLRVNNPPSTSHAHLAGTPQTRHHPRHHAAHHQPIADPGSGGPDTASDQGTAVDPADENDGSRHHGRDGDHRSNAGSCRQGHHGSDGDQGEHGDDGDQSDGGSDGDQADQGDQGDQSDQSDQADQGDQGDQGDLADQADQADQGDQGDLADQSLDGAQADQGAYGFRWSGAHGHGHGHGHGHWHGKHLGWSC